MAKYKFTKRSKTIIGRFVPAAGNGSIVAFDCEGQDSGNIAFDEKIVRCKVSTDLANSFVDIKIADYSWMDGREEVRLYYFGFSGGFFRVVIRVILYSETRSDQYVHFKSRDGLVWTSKNLDGFILENSENIIFISGALVVRKYTRDFIVSYDEGESFSDLDIVVPGFPRGFRPFMYEANSPSWAFVSGLLYLDKNNNKISYNTSGWFDVLGGGVYIENTDKLITHELLEFDRGDVYYGPSSIEGAYSFVRQDGATSHVLLVVGDYDGNYGIVRSNGVSIEAVAGVSIESFQEEYEGEVFEYLAYVYNGGIEPDPSFGPILSPNSEFINCICIGGDRHIFCIEDPYHDGVGETRFVLAEPSDEEVSVRPFWTNKIGSYEQQTKTMG